jgi:hypothetical protein
MTPEESLSVNGAEVGFTVVLVAVLLGLAVYFGRHQFRTLRALKTPEIASADERRYLRSQALRRLFCSGLMVLFAALLAGGLFLWNEYHALEEQAQQTEEQKDFFRFLITYYAGALLILMLLLALAAIDFWATARFGLRQHRQLQADHRALLQQDVARRRRDRNGSAGTGNSPPR